MLTTVCATGECFVPKVSGPRSTQRRENTKYTESHGFHGVVFLPKSDNNARAKGTKSWSDNVSIKLTSDPTRTDLTLPKSSDVNKDWTCKDKDKDQVYKDQDKD